LLTDLLTELRDRGVELRVEGERLAYRAPKGALTPELRCELAARNDELLAWCRQARPGLEELLPGAETRDAVPLSFAQEGLWFLEQLSPDGDVANLGQAMFLRGPLDEPALERALSDVVERHDSLRTTVSQTDDGVPRQVVVSDVTVALERADLTWLPGAERAGAARELAAQTLWPAFDLSRGPLVRVLLARLDAQEHLLVLVAHHVICDGWSLGVLIEELAAFYEAHAAGRELALPAPALRYADYATWQRRQLERGALEPALRYWREELSGAPRVLELPTDHPRPPVQSYAGACAHARWPREFVDALTELSAREGATLFMTLLSGFAVLLRRYTGQADMLIGSSVANRDLPGTERLIGLFLSTVALRCDLRGNPSFREVLRRVRRSTLGAHQHQDLPFELLVQELQPQRDPSRNPLFQVMVDFQPAAASAWRAAGVAAERVPLSAARARLDLTLEFVVGADGLDMVLEHCTALFETATAERMLSHLRVLLEAALVDPDRPVEEMPLLTPPEWLAIVEDWNDTQVAFPADQCLHRLFEEQAERTPEATAVVFEDRGLTYRALNERANRLARRLRVLGVRPEVPVGICMERSLEMVVALLGIMKAGGAYVPLDPGHPPEWIGSLLETTAAPVVVAQPGLRDRLATADVLVVDVDDASQPVANADAGNVEAAVGPDHLAYVVFTSGSTGRPKGVMVTHRGIVNYVTWMQREYALTAADRVLQSTTLSFDVSVWELFWPLIVGGCAVVAGPLGQRDPASLAELVARRGVTVLHLVPSALLALLSEPATTDCSSVSRVFCSGERLDVELQDQLCVTLPGADLVNLYGATEVSVDSTWWRCRPGRPVLAGRPLANTQVYVLDHWLSPVPVGVSGEVYIGGDSVARGYHGRPDLTAERFVPDPLGRAPGARLYRTGDVARFRADGCLDLLGRVDHQVKVRGHRIELGQVEAALLRHPAVREAVVVARGERVEDRLLVAYTVARPVPAAGELRAWLRGILPDAMVPSWFVDLAELPVTSNGKVDRKALPAPDEGATRATRFSETPRTEVQEVLAGIWGDVLKVPGVGLHDDFFELGGHSLLATRVALRVREVFGVALPLRRFFESPTVADLAKAVEEARGAGRLEGPPPRRLTHDGPRAMSYGQERLWFLSRLRPDCAFYNVLHALRLRGALRVGALKRSLRELAQRHEVLRTRFEEAGGRPAAVVSEQADLGLIRLDLRAVPAGEREERLRVELETAGRRPFDLERGPLVRALLVQLGQDEHVLLLALHHIVCDGWSLEVLEDELRTLYGAICAGEGCPALPDLPVQYSDYAAWLREPAQVTAMGARLGYWKDRLAGAPQVLELPADRPRPPVLSYAGAVCRRRLGPALVAGLRALGRQEGATLFMVLLSAFSVLLWRYTAQEEVVVGTPVANRERPEIERLVGFFVNTLPLRCDLRGEPTFRELVGRVRETTVDAHAHQEVPFERLVEELQPQRDLSRTPLFQVLLALESAERAVAAMGSLEVTRLTVDSGTSKFDLGLYLVEREGGLDVTAEYSTELFEPATVERLVGHLEVLLEGAVAEPDRPVGDLPLLGTSEADELDRWSRAEPWVPSDVTLPALFEAQARRRPDDVAVVCDGEPLTYRDLDRRANGLARRLRALGVGPEVCVGLCLERSLELVVAMLAVLKAGGAYLPMDPEYPGERLGYLLADAGAPVVVSQRAVAGRLPDGPWAVVLEEDESARAVEPDPSSGIMPDNAAYVIYTSGSTGRPKGVVVSHRNVVRLLTATQPWFEFGSADVWTLFHSYAFDFSVWEVWGALAHGGRLVVVPYLTSRSPDSFRELVCRERVTVLNQTPSAFFQFVRADEAAGTDDLALRLVIFGGEALETGKLRSWFDRHPPSRPRLVNMYGITETTVHVTYRPIELADVAGAGSPLGVAIPDLSLTVLDRRQGPVPVGVHGELFVGGPGLARGYLGRPGLTADRFRPDPAGLPGGRIYKTGDLVRRLRDGSLEYLGRNDQQVKVRGFRIELGEVETALAQHPAVGECAVVAREERLVGYVVPAAGQAPGVEELSRHLRRRLPGYMVPGAIVLMEALPLTVNGKLDRRVLPAPVGRPHLETAYRAPRGEIEEVLAAIWSEVLGVERVGTSDNFFALGGDSLRTLQVVAQARDRGLEMPIERLFEHQTIGELARELRFGAVVAPVSTRPFQLVAPGVLHQLPPGLEDAYPLTHMQSSMLHGLQREPDAPPYHNVTSFHLRVPLDLALLQRAVDTAMRRHPVLRTSFDLSSPGEPLQLVHAEARVPVGLSDLRGRVPTAQEEELDAFLDGQLMDLFDISVPPLLRLHVHRSGEETLWLTAVENHAILDGWSFNTMVGEILEDYVSLLRGQEPAERPRPAVAYRDYIQAERQALASDETRRFWERYLEGASPFRLPRSAVGARSSAHRGRRHDTYIPEDLTRELRRLADSLAVPLKSVLLAAHLKVMSILSGQDDVLTGLSSHGRPEVAGGDQVLGMFLITLPLRLRLAPGTWRELIRDAFEAERELTPHRLYPLAALQTWWGREPLLETGFNYLNFHPLRSALEGGRIESLGLKERAFNNLAMAAEFMLPSERTVTLLLALYCDSSVVGLEQQRAMTSQYLRVLESMAADAGRRHDGHRSLPPSDWRLMVEEWNRTDAEYPRGRCIHELFEKQAERTPDAVAVECDGRHLSYRELNRRANRVAARLRGLGVGAEVRVGLCVERSLELPVGVLGVLKAGGAYVPLDPEYPRERLEYLLRDSDVGVVLTQERLRGTVPDRGCVVLCLDADATGQDEEREANLGPMAAADNLAYVIYTSGTTGQPKGVAVPHRGVCNLLEASRHLFAMDEETRTLLVASFAFDISVMVMFGTLTSGGRLHVPAPGFVMDGKGLADLLNEHEVTHLMAPASLLALVPEDEVLPTLRTVGVGGEVCPATTYLRWSQRRRFVNGYGPTEATILQSAMTEWAVYRPEAGPPPIGRPMANVRFYVVDGFGQPVLVGVPGELLVGGVQVVRGYLGRPDLTAEKFVPDPFGMPGDRLYRTGDQVRWRGDGNLEFLGRIDEQVKIRGFRIEPGEVEAVLGRHPRVRECAVVPREDGDGQQRLVAYVVAGDERVTMTELREHVSASLPAHMVPALFVELAEMPLNAQGKMDRRALPAPEPRAEPDDRYVAPRTGVERKLARIWSEVLLVERVGVEDNFFELGGDSILSIRVAARARAAGLPVNVRQVFEHQTVAELAENLDVGAGEAEPELASLTPLEGLSQEELDLVLGDGMA
jgi:amino acid adenylation domain-containing protein